MLTNSFILVPGLSLETERSLWMQGALTWDDFLFDVKKWELNGMDSASAARVLKNSLKKLEVKEHSYFKRKLPSREAWRVFPEFRDKLVYVDIETDGGWGGHSITLIGVYDGKEFKVFTRNKDIHLFPDYITQYGVIVTFFGTSFDLPMLQKAFPFLKFPQIHIDLCPTLRKLGFRGGLKNIEKQLGIARSDETQGMSGMDAISLWRNYQSGNKKALDLLVEYNREDVVNLEKLMTFAYEDLRELTMPSPKKRATSSSLTNE